MKPERSGCRRALRIVIMLLSFGSVTRSQMTETAKVDFSTSKASQAFANEWEALGGTWTVKDQRLLGRAGMTRGFATLPEAPESPRAEIRVRMRIVQRTESSRWSTAGLVLLYDRSSYWHLALVEGPDGKRYAELVEMLRGNWQAQRDGCTALKQTRNDGQYAGWEYGHSYELKLMLDETGITGTVRDMLSGNILTQIAYAWGEAEAVRTGRPGMGIVGFEAAFETVIAHADVKAGAPEPAIAIQPGKCGSLAILEDDIGEPDLPRRVQRLTAHFRKAGFGVTPLRCEQLSSSDCLNASWFDALVLADSSRFPVPAEENLLRFLRDGGDLVLLGGLSFSKPLYPVKGTWRTEEEASNILGEELPDVLLFDFESGDVSGWSRVTNHAEQPSRASLQRAERGRCLQMSFRGVDGWDNFQRALPNGLPEGVNVLRFRARGDAQTGKLLVELREEDGTRWMTVVNLEAKWRWIALSLPQFEHWRDSTSVGRGGPLDAVRPEGVRMISFGLAGSHIPGTQGDHTVWLDDVGVSQEDRFLLRESSFQLPVFSDYEVYRMDGVRRVRALPQKRMPADVPLDVDAEANGWSAVGFAFPNESTFVPLADALDAQGRSLGWASGVLVNHSAGFRNSCWLLCGIESEKWILNSEFGPWLAETVKVICGKELPRRERVSEREERVREMDLKTPAAHEGFLHLSPDRRQILAPDGRPFFMIGCNYVGGLARCAGRMWRDDLYDARQVEDDFRKAHEAGLNIMRYWVQGPLDESLRRGDLRKVSAIRESARKYGVYLLLDLPGTGYPTEEAMVQSHQAIAKAFRDEPMVLGYDLRNEPYVTTLGGIRYKKGPVPVQSVDLLKQYPDAVDLAKVDAWLQERPWWLHLPLWIQGEEARNLAVANALWGQYTAEFDLRASSLPGLGRELPVGRWKPLLDAVDASLRRWVDIQVDAIREVDPNHLITVGHNTALCILPANERLDFVSKHTYVRPFSREDVIENMTTMDRLSERWSNRPITLGEFGYSNGIPMPKGALDPNASAVGEMMHFLYALSHGYGGCKKWMLVDWPLPVMRHYGDWNRGLATRIYEERFGLYFYDGTMAGRPKPIVPSLRFLREFVDAGRQGGKLEIIEENNPIRTGYLYRHPNALFVGGQKGSEKKLQFHASAPANVMLRWDEEKLYLMSSADADVRLDPTVFVKAIRSHDAQVQGHAEVRKMREGALSLKLLAGEEIVIQ